MAYELDIDAYHQTLLKTTLLEEWQANRLQLYQRIPQIYWAHVIRYRRPQAQLNADLVWLSQARVESQIDWIKTALRLLAYSTDDDTARRFLKRELGRIRGSQPQAVRSMISMPTSALDRGIDDVSTTRVAGAGAEPKARTNGRDSTNPESEHQPHGRLDDYQLPPTDPPASIPPSIVDECENRAADRWISVDEFDLLGEVHKALVDDSSMAAASTREALDSMKGQNRKTELLLRKGQLLSTPGLRLMGHSNRKDRISVDTLRKTLASFPIDRRGIRELQLSIQGASDSEARLLVSALTYRHELVQLVGWLLPPSPRPETMQLEANRR